MKNIGECNFHKDFVQQKNKNIFSDYLTNTVCFRYQLCKIKENLKKFLKNLVVILLFKEQITTIKSDLMKENVKTNLPTKKTRKYNKRTKNISPKEAKCQPERR